MTLPDPGEHEGLAPRSTDSAWVDLPAEVGQVGDLLSYVDTVDLLPRAYTLAGRPNRGAVGLRVRWIGLRLALPEGALAPFGAYPSVNWDGSDWVVRP